MSFTIPERIRLKTYLGYPYKDSNTYDGLESSIVYAEERPDLETAIRSLLTKLTTVETELDGLVSSMAGLKSVDKGDVVWQDSKGNCDAAAGALYSLARRYIGQISIMLEVPINADYFGTSGIPSPKRC